MRTFLFFVSMIGVGLNAYFLLHRQTPNPPATVAALAVSAFAAGTVFHSLCTR